MASSSIQRVKVYRLNDDGLWDDKGTGHVSVEYMEGDDTIITWSDADLGTDVALSFQESRGCNYVWEQIQQIQQDEGGAARRGGGASPRGGAGADGSPFGPGARRRAGLGVDEYDARHQGLGGGGGGPFDELGPGGPHGGGPGGVGPEPGSSGAVELPEPELANLPALARALSEASGAARARVCRRARVCVSVVAVSIFQRDRLAQQLLHRARYITRLLELFQQAEDLEDEETLRCLYGVMRGIIMLNDTTLLEILFGDEHVMDVVGCLEYEPEVPPALRPKHRRFLQEQYVKDVVLPRVLDDQTFSTLCSLILFNNVDVLMALQSDPTFFPELFRRLRGVAPGGEEWRDLVGFLQELCGLAKHLQASQRNSLLERLVSLGLFEVMTEVMASGDAGMRLKASDILLADVQHDPPALRAFLVGQEGRRLFELIMAALEARSDSGLQEQELEMLKLLLDPDTLDSSVEKDAFMDLFYDSYLKKARMGRRTWNLGILKPCGDVSGGPLLKNKFGLMLERLVLSAERTDDASALSAPTLGLLLDLLCFCVRHHTYRIKYYILKNNVVEKVLKLLRRPERWLVIAAIRFLRTCLGVKENMKGLVGYVVEHHWEQLKDIDYTDVFVRMKQRHDQHVDRLASGPGGGDGGRDGPGGGGAPPLDAAAARAAAAAETRRRRGEREEDEDEENYFREDDSDEEGQEAMQVDGPGPSPGGAAALEGRISPLLPREAGEGASRRDSIVANGRVVLEHTSPLPGLRGLVDYEDEEDDTLPLRAADHGTPKRGALVERPGSPPLEKRPRPESPAGGAPGGGGGGPHWDGRPGGGGRAGRIVFVAAGAGASPPAAAGPQAASPQAASAQRQREGRSPTQQPATAADGPAAVQAEAPPRQPPPQQQQQQQGAGGGARAPPEQQRLRQAAGAADGGGGGPA
eukprot:scaffold2.g7007.t1